MDDIVASTTLRETINKIIEQELSKVHLNETIDDLTFEINSKLISTFPGMKFRRFKKNDCNREGSVVTLGKISLKPADFGVFGSAIKSANLTIQAGCSLEYNACMIIGVFDYKHHYGSNGYTIIIRSSDGGKSWKQEK